MNKLTLMILTVILGSVISLTGCNTTENQVSAGVNKMLDTSAQLSKAINDGNQTKVKEIGPKLEKQWSVFEDDVKASHKALYEKIENVLDPTVAGSEAAQLDKEALAKLNNQLSDALKELSAKAK